MPLWTSQPGRHVGTPSAGMLGGINGLARAVGDAFGEQTKVRKAAPAGGSDSTAMDGITALEATINVYPK